MKKTRLLANLGSVGTAQSLVQVMVADENGMRSATGEVGGGSGQGPHRDEGLFE